MKGDNFWAWENEDIAEVPLTLIIYLLALFQLGIKGRLIWLQKVYE